MKIIPTPIEGLCEIIPTQFTDERGWFMESYHQVLLNKVTSNTRFVQDNMSFSKKNVLRGLHMQLHPHQQSKLVGVMYGEALDVVVDLRKNSKTFGQTYTCLLETRRHNMLYIPEGFAHGFLAIQDTLFFYKCSKSYHPESESGIRWNDPQLAIDWGITKPILAAKDKQLASMEALLTQSVIPITPFSLIDKNKPK